MPISQVVNAKGTFLKEIKCVTPVNSQMMRKERSLIADEQYEVHSIKAERGQVAAGEKSEDSREAGSCDLRKDVVSINKSTK